MLDSGKDSLRVWSGQRRFHRLGHLHAGRRGHPLPRLSEAFHEPVFKLKDQLPPLEVIPGCG